MFEIGDTVKYKYFNQDINFMITNITITASDNIISTLVEIRMIGHVGSINDCSIKKMKCSINDLILLKKGIKWES